MKTSAVILRDILLALAAFSLIALTLCTGCSGVKIIGNAAREAQAHALSASANLDAAVATGDVGKKATPYIDAAHDDIDAIAASADKIVDVVESGAVKDAESWLVRLLKSLGFWILLIAVVALSVLYAPIIRPLLLHLGAWINFIPKPIKVDAEADAELIAANENGKVKATVKQVAAIERKKAADPRYQKHLDKALNAEGVAT